MKPVDHIAFKKNGKAIVVSDQTAKQYLERPNRPGVRLTNLWIERGSPAEALDEAEAALRMRPWWPDALALRADALDALGQRTRAAAAREQWRAAEPPEGR